MIDPIPNILTVIGSAVILSCTSRGSPPDIFTWMKDGIPLSQFTSVTTVNYTNTSAVFHTDYTIDNITISDSGMYTCNVSNPIGSDSETISVAVIGM